MLPNQIQDSLVIGHGKPFLVSLKAYELPDSRYISYLFYNYLSTRF